MTTCYTEIMRPISEVHFDSNGENAKLSVPSLNGKVVTVLFFLAKDRLIDDLQSGSCEIVR